MTEVSLDDRIAVLRDRAKDAQAKAVRAEHQRDLAKTAVEAVQKELGELGIEPGQLAGEIVRTREAMDAEAARVEAALTEAGA